MRYIVYIFLIILLVSGFIGYRILPSPPFPDNPALVINDKVITPDTLDSLLTRKTPHLNRFEFIESVITEELLIQEALRQGIDRDGPFRQSVQDFYEQSLVKLLIDKKTDSLDIAVDDKDIERYVTLLKSRVLLTQFHLKTPDLNDGRWSTVQDKCIASNGDKTPVARNRSTFARVDIQTDRKRTRGLLR